MKFEIQLSREAEKFLKTIPKPFYKLISQHLDELAANPHPSGVIKLTNSNYYRLRVGTYRIIYEVHHQILVVHVVTIAHRKDAYRK